jgi:hypothetical protein
MPSKNMPATRQTASGRTTFLSKQLMSGCIAGKHDHLISNFKFQIRDLKFEIHQRWPPLEVTTPFSPPFGPHMRFLSGLHPKRKFLAFSLCGKDFNFHIV